MGTEQYGDWIPHSEPVSYTAADRMRDLAAWIALKEAFLGASQNAQQAKRETDEPKVTSDTAAYLAAWYQK